MLLLGLFRVTTWSPLMTAPRALLPRRTVARLLAVALALTLLGLVPGVEPAQAQAGDDTIAIVKQDEQLSNAELVARLSEATPLPDTRQIVVARDDEFADALASGLLQSTSPLMMVPRSGPIPDRVTEEIQRLGAENAVILGGTAAVGDDVEAQLTQMGLGTERRSGATRFDTAVQIAQSDAPDATTAILARAYPADANNPTQGFADALSSGAMAAENEWPILLTDTASMTPVTRSYLEQSQIERVMIVGGTAAVSAAVEQEVRSIVGDVTRIAGDTRFDTAVEVAKELGYGSASDVDHVVLVDGTSPAGFVGGFASAAHAALMDAPILLVDGIQVPSATSDFLEPGARFAQTDPVGVTCVVHPLACDGGREDLGLVDYPLLQVSPPIDSLVTAGQQVTLQLSPAAEGAFSDVTVKGSCLDGQVDLTTDGQGRATFTLGQGLSGNTCLLDATYGPEGETLRQGFGYALHPDFARAPDAISVASTIFSYGTQVPSTPIYVTDAIECTGPAGTVQREDSTYEARYVHPSFAVDTFSLTSAPVDALAGDTCTVTASLPDGVSRPQWGVYSWSDSGLRNPLKLGSGSTASFTFEELGTDVTDVNVVWILETHSTEIGLPAVPLDGPTGLVLNRDGIPVDCGSGQIPQGFSTQPSGATCSVSAPAGLQPLVVSPGVPLVPNTTSFVVPDTPAETTGIYTVAPTVGTPSLGSQGCVGAPELPYAEITSGQTTPSMPAAYYSFYAFEGETLRFRADNAFGDFEFGLDPVLAIYDPTGVEVAYNDDGDSGFNSRIDLTIPADGDYCLEVTGFGSSTGEFLLAADPAAFSTFSGTLTDTAPEAYYEEEFFADEVIIVEGRNPGFGTTDPIVGIFDQAGNQLAIDDDGGGFPNSRIEFPVPSPGLYTVGITTFDGLGGDFTLELSAAVGTGAFTAAGPHVAR